MCLKFCVYQINLKRDAERLAFEGLENLQRYHGSAEVPSDLYDKVYEGNMELSNLEDLFRLLNINLPDDYQARSMSVSDVVEIKEGGTQAESPGFYFCDSVGFKKIDFHPEQAGPDESNIRMQMTGY